MPFYSLLSESLFFNRGNKYFYLYQVSLAYNCVTMKSNQLQDTAIWPSILKIK